MKANVTAVRFTQYLGLLLVLTLHGAVIYAAWRYELIAPSAIDTTVFVNLVTPESPKKQVPKLVPAKPIKPKVTLVKQKPVPVPTTTAMLAASAAEIEVPTSAEPARIETTAPPAVTQTAAAAPVAAVMLTTELAVFCPQRSMPSYPGLSRRLLEQGQVVLRVELDARGRITSRKIAESSGYRRLDEAGLAAVQSWQCNAPMRNGVAVPAVALQPFDFIIEGR